MHDPHEPRPFPSACHEEPKSHAHLSCCLTHEPVAGHVALLITYTRTAQENPCERKPHETPKKIVVGSRPRITKAQHTLEDTKQLLVFEQSFPKTTMATKVEEDHTNH